MSWTTDRLRSFISLPYKQGILIELQQPSKISEDLSTITVLCILQDFQRTSNFLFYITGIKCVLTKINITINCRNLRVRAL